MKNNEIGMYGFDFKALEPDLRKICVVFGVRKLFSFGSVNTGQLRDNSDIDLLVEFSDLETPDLFDRYFGLKENLEMLLNRPVDLVFEKRFKNPYFNESVSKTKRVVYEA